MLQKCQKVLRKRLIYFLASPHAQFYHIQLSHNADEPRLSWRLLLLSISGLAMVLFASYTAVLTSNMTIQDTVQPISSLEDVRR